jgi:hypothetical protein
MPARNPKLFLENVSRAIPQDAQNSLTRIG